MNRYQTIGKRIVASIIDILIFLPLGFVDRWLIELPLVPPLMTVWLVILHLVVVFYTVLMLGIYGQTIGKMLMKLKVVTHDHETPITIGRAFVREIYMVVFNAALLVHDIYLSFSGIPIDRSGYNDTFLKVTMGITFIWSAAEITAVLKTRKRRAVHDFIGGTVVVRTDLAFEET